MRVPRRSKHSVVAMASGGLKFAAHVRDHAVMMDQPARAGGEDAAPSPLEMLSVALAGCIALYVQRYCASESLDAEGLAVEVKPVWRENPDRIGRFDVLVHMPETVPPELYAAIEEVARKCPVHHTLVERPEMTLQLQAEPAATGAAA